MSKYRVTVDTGGTFSDFVFFNEDTGEITITKVPSTPKEPFQAVLNGVKELIDQGVHLIDLSRWFLGDFTSVSGFAAAPNPTSHTTNSPR